MTEKQNGIGHNSKEFDEGLQKKILAYVECDKISMEQNDERAEIRKSAEEKYGVDPKAFQDYIARTKKDIRKREGYDEGTTIMKGVMGQMDMTDLWKHVYDREAVKQKRKEQEREEKAAVKKKAKAEAAKAEKFKAAPDRKPEPVKSVGKEQAAAYQKAHSKPVSVPNSTQPAATAATKH